MFILLHTHVIDPSIGAQGIFAAPSLFHIIRSTCARVTGIMRGNHAWLAFGLQIVQHHYLLDVEERHDETRRRVKKGSEEKDGSVFGACYCDCYAAFRETPWPWLGRLV